MYCHKCGKENPDNAYRCAHCGEALQPAGGPPPAPYVPTNLVWAILTTLLCCLPTGIVAIVYAAQVSPKAAAGDLAGAQEAARSAALWSWISFGIGLTLALAYMALVFLGVAAEHL